MELLMCVVIPGMAYVLGRAVNSVLYGRKNKLSAQDCFIAGGMVVIGLAEMVNVLVAFLGRPISLGTKFFAAALIGSVLAALLICCILKSKTMRETGKRFYLLRHQLPFYTFVILVVLQVVYIVGRMPVYLGGDMTLEMVESFLEEDSAYVINPLTGQSYEAGVPSRIKLLCLPTLYAMLSNIFHVKAVNVVWMLAPLFTLLGCYLVYSVLAKILFPQGAWRRGIFLLMVALLIWVGDYMLSVDGFDLLHAGYRGVTIRGAVLVPYTISLILRKKYKLVIVCALTEACIVWTFYGLGACLLVAVFMVAVEKVGQYVSARKSGKEDAVCNS